MCLVIVFLIFLFITCFFQLALISFQKLCELFFHFRGISPSSCLIALKNVSRTSMVAFNLTTCPSFGTIRNSTALKPRGLFFLTKFRNRAICLSQTSASNSSFMLALLYLKSLVISMFLSIHIIYSCNFFSKAWVKTSE